MSIHYTSGEERANYLTHAFGFVMIAAAAVSLIVRHDAGDMPVFILGMVLYVLGAGTSYLASALYHSSSSEGCAREKLRKLDHAAIYWHIAGSYSPITLSGMAENQEWGLGLFAAVWLCAAAGTTISFRKLKEHSNVETLCFVFMGLLVLVAFDKVLQCIGWRSMSWIIAEGAAFIIGALFYSINKVAYMHTVFHVFVLLGSFCHIAALYCMFQ